MNNLFDFSTLTFGGRLCMVLLLSGFIGIFGIWLIRGIFRLSLYTYEMVRGPITNPIVKSMRKVFNDSLLIVAIPLSIFISGVGMTFIVGWLQI